MYTWIYRVKCGGLLVSLVIRMCQGGGSLGKERERRKKNEKECVEK